MNHAAVADPTDRSLWRVPEVGVAFLSFILHFVWEFLQVPAFEGMMTTPHWQGIKICTSATAGDVGIALTAFWITAAASRSRHWIAAPRLWQMGLFVLAGVLITVGFEYHATEIASRWTYSDLMPLVPPLGTGLLPLLQWIVVPLLILSLTRRLVTPATP